MSINLKIALILSICMRQKLEMKFLGAGYILVGGLFLSIILNYINLHRHHQNHHHHHNHHNYHHYQVKSKDDGQLFFIQDHYCDSTPFRNHHENSYLSS
jgi:uncharacterized membrane protein